MGPISNIMSEIDWLVKRVLEFDSMAIRKADSCARITGKGFGRCTYTIIKNEDVETICKNFLIMREFLAFIQ